MELRPNGKVLHPVEKAAIATTVTITDNEDEDEDNALIFTAGGDVDGGNLGLESDGTLTYNPSSGTVTATVFAGNIDAVDGFIGTKIYKQISSGKFHDVWFEELEKNKINVSKTEQTQIS